jgi:multisubunit Na+/H+ antiporter MnhG subunit
MVSMTSIGLINVLSNASTSATMMAVFASVIAAPGNNHAAAYAATAVISTLIINPIMLILNKCSYSAFAITGSFLQQNHYNDFLQLQQKAFIYLADLNVKIEIDDY